MKAFIMDGGGSKFSYLGVEKEKDLRTNLIRHIAKALGESKSVDEIILITAFEGHVRLADEFPGMKIVKTGQDKSITDNLKLALKYVNNFDEHAIFSSSDIPLIDAESVDKFVKQSLELDTDIIYPVIPKKYTLRLSKNVKRTFINLKDGSYTGGNIFLVNLNILEKVMPNIDLIYSLRKSPKKMVKTLGLLFILKLILRQLSVKELEKRCTDLLKVRCRALVTSDAKLGMDIDKESDLSLI